MPAFTVGKPYYHHTYRLFSVAVRAESMSCIVKCMQAEQGRAERHFIGAEHFFGIVIVVPMRPKIYVCGAVFWYMYNAVDHMVPRETI